MSRLGCIVLVFLFAEARFGFQVLRSKQVGVHVVYHTYAQLITSSKAVVHFTWFPEIPPGVTAFFIATLKQLLHKGTFQTHIPFRSSAPLGDHGAVLRPLRNSSAAILQNPIDEQGATSVGSLWKGAANHEWKFENHWTSMSYNTPRRLRHHP